MILTTVSTGSKGNAYILSSGDHSLLLDAGVPWAEIINCPSYSPRTMEGVLVTHEHMDHFKAAEMFVKCAVPVYASRGTWGSLLDQPSHFRRVAINGSQIETNGFIIRPFSTEHDAAEPLGFLIKAKGSGETLVYATDTYYLHYVFPGVNYWLIECNYCHDLLINQMADGSISMAQCNRLLNSHMSMEHLLEALKANNLTHTRQIIICHLSDQRSDEQMMINRIEGETGIPCQAAHNKETIALALTPF